MGTLYCSSLVKSGVPIANESFIGCTSGCIFELVFDVEVMISWPDCWTVVLCKAFIICSPLLMASFLFAVVLSGVRSLL